jgi:hypothetical protein
MSGVEALARRRPAKASTPIQKHYPNIYNPTTPFPQTTIYCKITL